MNVTILCRDEMLASSLLVMLGYPTTASSFMRWMNSSKKSQFNVATVRLGSNVVAELMQGTTLPKTNVDKSIRKKRMKLKHAQQKFILEPISNVCDILGFDAGVQIHSRHFTNLCIRSQASED